ncbi:MAG: hypothetical protein DA408_03530 [Bacteroidetes bacterium]|nr:MAG: hypothetical protein C7N36_00320 [Bacteroidota bacterium]PTM14357.1 MAG: hypothetical protein DA408_03530 [Bacteroidota bacterium]
MKNMILWLLLANTFLLTCDPPIAFTKPQPDVYPAATAFEPAYQGSYFCTGDSAILHVTDQGIYKEKTIEFETTLEEIKATKGVHLEGDQLYFDRSAEPIDLIYLDDNVVSGQLVLRDTLFWLRYGQVLKYYKGHQVLNKKLPNKQWAVQVLSMDEDGNLTLFTTKLPEDLAELEAITPVTDISTEEHTQYLIAPNVAEFRKLLTTQLIFEACDYFERLPGTL